MSWNWHRPLEAKQLLLAVLAFVFVTIGGLVLLIPPYFLQGTIPLIAGVKPYSALELEGRDLYIREGCNTCHSQQVRPFKTETGRYGPFSMAGEGIYDRPFLWGSRRTGPDLARVGGKYPDSWHWMHLVGSAPDRAALEHAVLRVPHAAAARSLAHAAQARGAAQPRHALHRRADPGRRGGCQRVRPTGSWRRCARTASTSERSARAAKRSRLIAYLQHLGRDIGWREQPIGTASLGPAR